MDKMIKIANITGMALFVDGTKLLPGQDKVVKETNEIKKRIENGFFKIVNEIKENINEPVKKEVKKEPVKEQEPKKAAVMMSKMEKKPMLQKKYKNN